MGWSSQAVVANKVIIEGPDDYLLVYDASGNLIASIAAAAGTDPDGHAYKPVITVYNPATGASAQLQSGILGFGTGDPGESAHGDITSQIIGSGPTRQLATFIDSPEFGGGATAEITLTSGSEDGTTFSSSISLSTATGGPALYLGGDPNGVPEIAAGNGYFTSSGGYGDPDTGLIQWIPVTTYVASDVSTTSTSGVSAAGQTVISGHTYVFEARMRVTKATTDSSGMGVSGPSMSSTAPGMWVDIIHSSESLVTAATSIPGTGSNATAGDHFITFTGYFTPSANGTFALFVKAGAAGDTTTIRAGSALTIQRVA